jgi:ribosomal S20-like protein
VVVAISALDRAVAKGVLHRNNAARRKARLMRRLNAEMQAPAAPVAPAAPAKGASRASRSKAPSRKR